MLPVRAAVDREPEPVQQPKPQCGGLLRTCLADVRAAARLRRTRLSPVTMAEVLMLPAVWAVIIFRVGNAFHHRGFRLLSRPLWFANTVLFGCDLQMGASVGPGLALDHPAGTGFGAETRLGRDVVLMSGVRLGGGGYEASSQDGQPTIGDGCWLLDGAKLFGPIEVGAGAVVGINAVVTRDVPAGARIEGSPARLVR